MHIRAALDAYATQLAADGRSRHTIHQARRHAGLLAGWLEAGHGPTDVRRLTPEIVARFLTSPVMATTHDGRPRKASSANSVRTTMRVFGRFLVDAGYAESNVARLVRLARTAPRPPRSLSEAELAHIFEAVDESRCRTAVRDRMLLRVLFGAGLRLSSALSLRVEDVDLPRRLLSVTRAKNDAPHVLPISEALARELARYLRAHKGRWLFEGMPGHPLGARSASRCIRGYAEATGLAGRVSAHAFRHSLGQRIYDRTGDMALVSAALGHRNLQSAGVYARTGHDALRRALDG